MRTIFIIFLIATFLLGILFIFYSNENIANANTSKCPKLLVRKGTQFYLYPDVNDFRLHTDGLSGGSPPLQIFSSLEEYKEYLERQRKNGVRCPILYLQQENDLQGKDVYKIRPSPFEPNGDPTAPRTEQFVPEIAVSYPPPIASSAIANKPYSSFSPPPVVENRPSPVEVQDASRSNPPYNAGQYSGFDAHGQHIGVFTEIDVVHEKTQDERVSDNPMDPNWGGVIYTQQAVDTGKYDENNVFKPNYYTPKNWGQYLLFQPNGPGSPPPPLSG